MTDEQLIDALIREREREFVDNPADRGGATKYGITARELGRWRRLGRPATRAEVQALSTKEARLIFAAWYLAPFTWVHDDSLRAHLFDFGANSGVTTAVEHLQRVLGVTVDGIMGVRTKGALAAADARLINNALVGARCRLLSAIVDHRPSQLEFFHGWVRRAVSFYI